MVGAEGGVCRWRGVNHSPRGMHKSRWKQVLPHGGGDIEREELVLPDPKPMNAQWQQDSEVRNPQSVDYYM